MAESTEPTQATLPAIAGKLDLIDLKVDMIKECTKDHETRIRSVEGKSITFGVIFSLTSLAGIIALIKVVFGV